MKRKPVIKIDARCEKHVIAALAYKAGIEEGQRQLKEKILEAMK